MDKKKSFEEKTYLHKGYLYWKDSGNSVHRSRAYKEIYLKDREKYPFPFQEYQVHHKDGNKKNNRIENLKLILLREHEAKHKIVRYEFLAIHSLFVLLLIFSSWWAYLVIVSGYIATFKDILFMIATLVIGWILLEIVNRKKKGFTYK